MPIFDWYPTRKREAERTGQAEVYRYDELPKPLRVQIVRILREALGPGEPVVYASQGETRWEAINNVVTRELGMLALGSEPTYEQKCVSWLLHRASTDEALGMIELGFTWIDEVTRKWDDLKLRQEGIR
jgi:hypothetical protein